MDDDDDRDDGRTVDDRAADDAREDAELEHRAEMAQREARMIVTVDEADSAAQLAAAELRAENARLLAQTKALKARVNELEAQLQSARNAALSARTFKGEY